MTLFQIRQLHDPKDDEANSTTTMERLYNAEEGDEITFLYATDLTCHAVIVEDAISVQSSHLDDTVENCGPVRHIAGTLVGKQIPSVISIYSGYSLSGVMVA